MSVTDLSYNPVKGQNFSEVLLHVDCRHLVATRSIINALARSKDQWPTSLRLSKIKIPQLVFALCIYTIAGSQPKWPMVQAINLVQGINSIKRE